MNRVRQLGALLTFRREMILDHIYVQLVGQGFYIFFIKSYINKIIASAANDSENFLTKGEITFCHNDFNYSKTKRL